MMSSELGNLPALALDVNLAALRSTLGDYDGLGEPKFHTLRQKSRLKGKSNEQFHLVLSRESWWRCTGWTVRRPMRVANGGVNLKPNQRDLGSRTNGDSV